MTESARTSQRAAGGISRRRFLATSAAAGAATFAAPAFLRGRNLNSKLNIAMIACGGRGAKNLESVKDENITVLCDVYEPAVLKAAERFTQAKQFKDFRRVYDEPNLYDAVVVSTPEHTHAFATLTALQLGKHVYCEKPLTHNIWEARLIREAAAKANVATQMGNQNHANDNFREVIELVRGGTIGPVREAHVWVSRAWGWQSAADAEKYGDRVSTQDLPSQAAPVPEGLDWQLWLGPLADQPFYDDYWPGPKWYRYWEFGNGTMSDLGSHWNDLPFWALELKAPLTVEASGPPPHKYIAPASMQATYEYAARGNQPQVTLTWYQGVNKPQLYTEGKIPQWQNGMLFIGDDGMILADYFKHMLLPEDKYSGYQKPKPSIPSSPGHHAEWIAACKTGSPTLSNFEYAGWLTEANHLGNVAYRVGKKLEWDPTQMRATNAPEADQYIRREYRDGWKLG